LNANYFGKHCPRRDHLYAEISERSGIPVVLLGPKILGERLAKYGANVIVRERVSPADYFAAISGSEAVLDSPDWNGANTTIEALALGKAVVSLPGEFMRGRHGLAFLRMAGVEGLIARDETDYVALACDSDRRNTELESLNAAALFEDPAPARRLDEVLLT
jgi:predicted O-linked N-acetylglucosamine transferase (SPINDLY family)